MTDNELFIPGYHIVRLDRNRNGGGVLFYVSTCLSFSVLPKCDDVELLTIMISNGLSKLCISLFYRPPSSPSLILDSLCAYIESLNIHQYSNFILLGDFNINYLFSLCNNPLLCKLKSLYNVFSVQQIVPEPTHVHHNGSTSLIDLVFVSNNLLTNFCNVISPLSNSDHNGIHLQCRWRLTARYNCVNISKGRIVWCYDQANWERAMMLIDSFDWTILFSNDINETWTKWCDQFLKIMCECIPTKTLPNRKNLPWLSKDLVNSIKRRNLLYKKGKLRGNLSMYKVMRNRVTSNLRKAKKAYFQNIDPKNPKEFWKLIKYLSKKQSSIPTLIDENGSEALTGLQKADVLNNFFSKCFNRLCAPLDDWSESDIKLADDLPDDLLCDEDNVCNLLTNLDVSKSSGPDRISAKMLKHTAVSIAPSITKLFNLSITNGRVPRGWKLSSVVPIPKSGKPQSPDNYRPISLLCILSKVLEKHIHNLIFKHLNQCYPLSDCQWGFRSDRSTVSALLLTIHHWLELMESGKDVCAVFLDYRKAFDSVPHTPLMAKMQSIGLHANLLAWLWDYLTSRKQQVVVDGATSNQVSVVSGVPQGSVLGPLLFSIYINSISEVDVSPHSHSVLYCDDVLLYRGISQEEDLLAVQSDINKLEKWSNEHLLQLNPNKCKYMVLSKKTKSNKDVSLCLGGYTLGEVESFKYLGVLIHNKLTWSDHILGICNKAKQILGIIYRQFYNNSSPATLKQLYLALVRPHLEYACQLWDPHSQNDVNRLESVQRFALKLISHRWDASYEELITLTNLSNRRLHLKLAQIYKIVHGLCYFPEDIFNIQLAHSNRLARVQTIRCPFARTNYYYHSFVPSSIRAWNSLEEVQVNAPSLRSFKFLLTQT